MFTDRFLDLCEEHDTLSAFVLAAEEHSALEALLEPYDVDALEQARRHVREVFTHDRHGQDFSTINAYREALKPLLGQGLTLRQLAIYVELPLETVVAHAMNTQYVKWAEQIADLEELLLVDREAAFEFRKEHGLTVNIEKTLAEWHKLPTPQETRGCRKYTQYHCDAALALKHEGLGLSAIATELRARYPELEGLTYAGVVSMLRTHGLYPRTPRAQRRSMVA